jgi:predicted Zn-ribbon and HTH transcriptional regulator
MGRIKLVVDGWRCERCGYEWAQRDPKKTPKVCANPKCKSPYFDRPRRADLTRVRPSK